MAGVNSCAVCGFPIVASGKCLHTIIGYNEKQWNEIAMEAGLDDDERGEAHLVVAQKPVRQPDLFAQWAARLFWVFILTMIAFTVAGAWYRLFWLGWVMQ